MPKLDGTGPTGQGAGSGRGMGSCSRDTGMRRGCYGRNEPARQRYISPINELAALEDEEKILLEKLKNIKAEKEALKEQK